MSLAAARFRTAPVAASARAGARRASARACAPPRRRAVPLAITETPAPRFGSRPRRRGARRVAGSMRVLRRARGRGGGPLAPTRSCWWVSPRTRPAVARGAGRHRGWVRAARDVRRRVDGRDLGEALETVQADACSVNAAGGIPDRVMFFSGMVGGEIMQLVDLFNGLNIRRPPRARCRTTGTGRCATWSARSPRHRVMMEREAAGGEINAETVNSDAYKTNERRRRRSR